MQHQIQPKYSITNVTCSCGNHFSVGSASGQETLQIDICSACHPFYTGTQKIVDTEGRVDSFAKRFGNFSLLGETQGEEQNKDKKV